MLQLLILLVAQALTNAHCLNNKLATNHPDVDLDATTTGPWKTIVCKSMGSDEAEK